MPNLDFPHQAAREAHNAAALEWQDALRRLVRHHLPVLREDLIDATANALEAAAGHGDSHALGWKPVFDISADAASLAYYRTHFVVAQEQARHCANLIRYGRVRTDLVTVLYVLRRMIIAEGLNISPEAFEAAIDAHLNPPVAPPPRAEPPKDYEGFLAHFQLYVDPTMAHALLHRYAPDHTRILIASPGADLMRSLRPDLRAASEDTVRHAESWFISVARGINPQLDAGPVRAMLGGIEGATRGEIVGAYGASLMDETGAFGQFDVMHALGMGFSILSENSEMTMRRWIGPTPERGFERLRTARDAPEGQRDGATREAVHANGNDHFSELATADRDAPYSEVGGGGVGEGEGSSRVRDGLMLRGTMRESFGSADLFTPGRDTFAEMAVALGVNPDRARARLGKYGGADFSMPGDQGAYPIPTNSELKWRRIGNAARFVGNISKDTVDFVFDLVDITSPADIATAIPNYVTDLIDDAKQGKIDIDATAKDQARRDLFGADPAPEPPKTPDVPAPTPTPAPAPAPANDPNGDPALAGTDGVPVTDVRAVDPEFASDQGGGHVPLEVAMDAVRTKLMADVNFLPPEFSGRDISWMTADQIYEKIAMAILPWIYPLHPDFAELQTGGNSMGSPNRDNVNVSDPPRPRPI